MANRKAKGILLYNLLMKEITKVNKNLPENRRLSVKERREIISKKIYPKYKDQARSRIRLIPLREKITRTVKRLPKREQCDLLSIDPTLYLAITYYEIEQFVGNTLPKCIYVKVDAGEFGSTNIFNTRDFDYYSTGLSEITNKINEYSRTNSLNTSNVPEYDGSINIRPGKKNDGTADNYFLEMILNIGTKRKSTSIVIPKRKKTKQLSDSKKKINESIRGRIKEMKSKKKKGLWSKMNINMSNTFRLIENFKTVKYVISRSKRKSDIAALYKGLSKKAKEYRDEGKITDRRYKSVLKRIADHKKKWKN